MAYVGNQRVNWGLRLPARNISLTAERALPQFPTTRIERFLLIATVALLPLQNELPAIGGFSSLFFLFGVLGAYVLLNRASILLTTLMHPVFLVSYAFIVVSAFSESLSPMQMYSDVIRFGQMVAGAILVASLCRDRLALRASLYGCIGAAVCLSAVLFFTSYGALRGAVATDFHSANDVRGEAFEEVPLVGNLNGIAFMSAQGGIIALALALANRSMRSRVMYLGLASFCVVSSLLTMSRGALATCIVSGAALMSAHGTRNKKAIMPIAIVVALVFLMLPNAVWLRMTYSTESVGGKLESRAWVYTTAMSRLPEYLLTGVGAGNFWNKWGFEKGFASGSDFSYDVVGAHNSFLQVTIYWGLPGLLAFLAVIWSAYRCFPRQCERDVLALGLLVIAVSLVVLMMIAHNFYDKSFALGLGMLVGVRRWIWPTGVVPAVDVNKG